MLLVIIAIRDDFLAYRACRTLCDGLGTGSGWSRLRVGSRLGDDVRRESEERKRRIPTFGKSLARILDDLLDVLDPVGDLVEARVKRESLQRSNTRDPGVTGSSRCRGCDGDDRRGFLGHHGVGLLWLDRWRLDLGGVHRADGLFGLR